MTARRLKARLKDDYPRPWEMGPISEERWIRHRERMLANAGPGRRPSEWWLYEKQRRQPLGVGDQHVTLFEMGELSAAELAKLMPRWREEYERANDPAFSYCVGQVAGVAKWLKGSAARRAHYRWVGIPREILRLWDAERKRRTKAIRKWEKAKA